MRLFYISGVIPYEDEGGGSGYDDGDTSEYPEIDATGSPLSPLQLLPNYDYEEEKTDPTLEAIAKREEEDYKDPTMFEEEVVKSQMTLTQSGSPYVIKHDVLITPKGILNVEPGVTIRFKEAVGITVRGVLNADGKLLLFLLYNYSSN